MLAQGKSIPGGVARCAVLGSTGSAPVQREIGVPSPPVGQGAATRADLPAAPERSEPAPADGANPPRDAAGCGAQADRVPGTRPGIIDLVGLRGGSAGPAATAGSIEPPCRSAAGRRWDAAGGTRCRASGRLHGLSRLPDAGGTVQSGVPPSR
ncbi:unnamed protein product [Coccothraustes coccothraustes]